MSCEPARVIPVRQRGRIDRERHRRCGGVRRGRTGGRAKAGEIPHERGILRSDVHARWRDDLASHPVRPRHRSGCLTRGIYSPRVRQLSSARHRSSRTSAVIWSVDMRRLLPAREGSGDPTRGIYLARVIDLVGLVQGTSRTGEGDYPAWSRHRRIGRQASCRSTRPIYPVHVTHLVDRRDPSRQRA
jgi:hypothetical protein